MKQHCSLARQAKGAVERSLGWVATAEGLYDLGSGIYDAGRYIAPIVAGLL